MDTVLGNRYTLEELLGQGGMGAVYRATDRLTGDIIALKQVLAKRDDLIFASTNDRLYAGSLEIALANEFQLLASLRHPNIISVLDYGFDAEQQPYFTMEFLHDAVTVLDAGHDQTLETKVQLVIELLQALVYLHRHELLHRDLKPQNILVSNNTVRILDFGLSISGKTGRGQVGTLAYMAPEIIGEAQASTASDLYSVGVIAYQLFTGKHPFKTEGGSIGQLLKAILYEPPPDEALDSVPPALAKVIVTLLEKRPEDRFPSARAVIEAICHAVDQPVPDESQAVRESFLSGARFIGRQKELQTLTTALDNARSNQGSAWLISGESGVGKSRLLEEVRTHALVSGLMVLRGRAISEGGSPYHLWQEPLRRLIISTKVDDFQAGVLKEVLPDIEILLERPVPDARVKQGAVWQQHFIITLSDLIARQRTPVLLLLEDLQWAQSAVEILKQLSTRAASLPLIILGSFREDEAPNLPENLPDMGVIHLQRFTREDIIALSASMIGEAAQREDVVQLLERETVGNAYFLVETVRALAENAGSLSRIGVQTIPQSVFAGGVHQILRRRLDHISANEREMLKLAAVAGRQLDVKLLRALPTAISHFDEWLLNCTQAVILQVQENTYQFVHDKLREQVLDDLTDEETRLLNRQVAETIEQVYADQLKEYAYPLVNYWKHAGDNQKEAHYALIAADQLHARDLQHEAKAMYLRVLELNGYEHADEPQAALAYLKSQIGRCCQRTSDYATAVTWHQEARTLYESLGNRLETAHETDHIGEALLWQGEYDQARQYVEAALVVFREFDQPFMIGSSLFNVGIISSMQGDNLKARDYFLEAYDQMQRTGDPIEIAKALNNLGVVYDILGDMPNSRHYLEEGLRIRREINDRRGVCSSLVNLFQHSFKAGEYALSREQMLEAIELARQVGDRMALAHATGNLGQIEMTLENYDAARVHYQEELALCRLMGDRHGTAITLQHLGRIDVKQKNDKAAWDYFQQALRQAQEINALHVVLGTLLHIADVLERLQRNTDALLILLVAQRELAAHPSDLPDQAEHIRALTSQLSAVEVAAVEQAAPEISIERLAESLLDKQPDQVKLFEDYTAKQ